MERPQNRKGAVVIRCRFGEVAADRRNFTLTWQEMMKSEAWRNAIGIKGGPFCYTDIEREIPF